MLDQNYQDTAHLLRRAGFGADVGDVSAAASQGLSTVTESLLRPVPDPIDDDQVIQQLSDLMPEDQRTNRLGREFLPLQIAKMWWLHRMIASPNPLVEKMTLFWHGHFTSKDGGQQGGDMVVQNQLFRQNALGNFRTLTLAVSRNPEMLRYLNGNQNFKAHPNENYGRELMELYTCGIGNYTENDVKAAARAFSGWNLRAGDFYFNPYQHDDTEKTFLGKTGNWNGDDIVDMLVAHPATARRLCTQLFAYFAYPDPEPAVIDSLVQTYYSSGYDIRTILSAIFRSRAFYSNKARYAVIKCPVQYVVGTVKMLGLSDAFALPVPQAADDTSMQGAAPGGTFVQNLRSVRLGGLAYLPVALRQMGQDILEPPSVKGWDGNEDWINSATMLARINFANLISRSQQAFGGDFSSAAQFLTQRGMNYAGWVDFLAASLGPLPIEPATRQTLISYADGTGNFQQDGADSAAVVPVANVPAQAGGEGMRGQYRAFARGIEGRLRGVIPLIMATPEYQVC